MSADSTRRQQRGRPWPKGTSGNPAGRPKGSGLSGELRAAIATEASAILAALIGRAKEGDVQASRVLLDRVLPALKPEGAPVRLPGLADGTLAERAEAALRAAGTGEVAPDVAAALVAAVGGLARIVEVEELERRIAALEKQIP